MSRSRRGSSSGRESDGWGSTSLQYQAALLAGVSGRAKSDWTERTLVTVDVTGTWSGRVSAGAGAQVGPTGTLWFVLEQKGATVNGLLQYQGGWGTGLQADA